MKWPGIGLTSKCLQAGYRAGVVTEFNRTKKEHVFLMDSLKTQAKEAEIREDFNSHQNQNP